MAKFNGSKSGRGSVTTPWVESPRGPSTSTGQAQTYEGGVGYVRDERSELVMLAVTNMVGTDTFYESAHDRDDRFRTLVRAVAVAGDDGGKWLADFIRWLRDEANMRSASIVVAAEAVHARLRAGQTGGNRQLVTSAISRADEPGEMLSYWKARFGHNIPKPIKRGVADAVRLLYTERNFLKYDSSNASFRFADVIELTHPSPRVSVTFNQSKLFRHILDTRHGRGRDLATLEADGGLPTIVANGVMREYARVRPDTFATIIRDPAKLRDAGMTWEDVLSLGGQHGIPKKDLWEAVIPSMGYMALLRNLRNFDEVDVSDEVAARVAARLADPEEVAKSRQFPYRFLSAYRAAPSLRWGHALDKALSASCANVPTFAGRTLVVVDTSGSMSSPVSHRSDITHLDVGAVFGAVLAHRGAQVDLVGFADGSFKHHIPHGTSVMRVVDQFTRRSGEVGHGTQTVRALRDHYAGHDRVVLISDMQCFHYDDAWDYTAHVRGSSGTSVSNVIPPDVPFFSVNTAGYATAGVDLSKPNRYEVGGFSDKLFTVMDLLSRGVDAGWPWE